MTRAVDRGTSRLPAAALKPLDIGNGSLVASFAVSRPALLALTCYHAQHGVAELSAASAFDESSRGDPAAVRRYRQLLASDDFLCLELETPDGRPVLAERVDTGDPERPRWEGPVSAGAFAEDDAIVLQWRVEATGLAESRLRFRGRIDRPALVEITELDPPEPTGAVTTLHADGSRLVVRSTLPAAIAIEVSAGDWVVEGDDAYVELGTALSVRLTAVDGLPGGRRRANASGTGIGSANRIVQRALAYTRNCTALDTAPDELVLLADHRLLPLSWTRDAYYQALLLFATGDPADAELVADHLRWLWRRCVRPGGRWLRSHHANGRPKDMAFQADQQLYPMLELADYWRARATLPGDVDWPAEVRTAWNAVLEEIDPELGLMATAENAADDPVTAPFVAASQVLLWYTAVRLAELAEVEDIGLKSGDFRSVASRVRQAFDRHLVDGGRWVYATDTRGIHVDYHDANDLPVALAPLLGFCPADDTGWRATMDFAFSEANPGYFPGEWGGLGSAHTPMPWTLGDIQAWIRARITGDEAGMAVAERRLAEVAFHDGMLPEAYSATGDPDVRIRHWFAWPGAALGALLLLDTRGELDRLET